MLNLGKVEAARLRQAIEDLQAQVANGAIPRDGATSMEVARLIDSAERRISEIERKDEMGREKEREENVRNLAIAYKVEQEAALNAEEKRQYEAFLKKEHFTKADFESLEKFYTNSYDKLTDGGKAEMSTRVWEVVRRDEYTFSELPEVVKEKESDRLRGLMSAGKELPPELIRIPKRDREEFLEQMEKGARGAAYEVLDRSSFRENVALKSRAVESEGSVAKVSPASIPKAKSEVQQSADISSTRSGKAGVVGDSEFDLADISLTNSEGATPSAPLTGGAVSPKGRSQ